MRQLLRLALLKLGMAALLLGAATVCSGCSWIRSACPPAPMAEAGACDDAQAELLAWAEAHRGRSARILP